MDPNQTTTAATSSQPGVVRISSNRLLSLPFLVGVLLFFMPFIDIRCNNVSVQQVSGIKLATGFEIKKNDGSSIFGNLDMKDNAGDTTTVSQRDGDIYALIALVIGTIGFILSLLHFKGKGIACIIAGIGAAAALVGLMADIHSQLKLDLSARTDFASIQLSIDFTAWFYLALVSFLFGAYLSYRSLKNRPPA